jgi:hypothetical protein
MAKKKKGRRSTSGGGKGGKKSSKNDNTTPSSTTSSHPQKQRKEVCASCGIAALKFCGDCDLVKYCSDECQENHREHHEQECKKRKAELHGKKIFTQPDSSHLGECPICYLPLPLHPSKTMFMSCCSKIICHGCNYANVTREFAEGLENRCAFCREPEANSEEESIERIMKRNIMIQSQ